MDLSECVSVCWPVDLLWPPAACRTLGDLAPDGGLARHHYWLSHSVRQVIPLHGVCVRADVCVWVHKVVAAGRCPKHQMGETPWAKVVQFHRK